MPGPSRAPARLRTTVVVTALSIGIPALMLSSVPGAGAVHGSQPVATVEPGHCEVTPTSAVHPSQVLIGGLVELELALSARCGERPIHAVLVVDGSSQVDGTVSEDLVEWIYDFIVYLEVPARPWVKLAVVEYDDSAEVRCGLTNDGDALRRCADGIVASGQESRLDLGVEAASALLQDARPTLSTADAMTDFDYSAPMEWIIALMASKPSDCPLAITEAERAVDERGVGAVATLCAGTSCDLACAQQVATTARYSFDLDEWADFLVEWEDSLEPPRMYRAAITQTLGSSLDYLRYSAQPVATETASGVVWPSVLANGNRLTVTIQAYAVTPGLIQVNDHAVARVSNRAAPGADVRFPARTLVVEAPLRPIWIPLAIHGR